MTARMRDVARQAGVSMKTVSNVINHYPHVTPATRAKVEAAIAELDYRPNLGARSLRKGHCGVIALVIPDLAVEYFAGLAAAVGRAAKKRGVAVLIEQTDGDHGAEELALDGLRDRLVDGILLWPSASAGTAAAPSRPVVLLGEGRPDLACDRVSVESVHHARDRVSVESVHSARDRVSIESVQLAGDRVSIEPAQWVITASSDHHAFAGTAVDLLLDHVAGLGPPEPRHILIPAAGRS